MENIPIHIDMEKNKKKIIRIAGAALALLSLTVSLCKIKSNGKPVIAFYGLSEREANGIKEEIIRLTGNDYDFAMLGAQSTSHEKSAEKEFKKQMSETNPALVFVKSGKNIDNAISFAGKKTAIAPGKINEGEMTTSIRGGIIRDKTGVKAVPLLTDHLEIDIDMVAYRNSGMQQINSWEDIEEFANLQKKYVEFPIVFAGKDAALTLDILGALTEAISGEEVYHEAVQIINEHSGKKFNAPVVAKLLTEKNGDPLNQSVKYLAKLYKTNLLHPNTFSLSKDEVKAFARVRIAPIVIMSLDDHRDTDHNTISRFSTIYFPSKFPASRRKFTAPTIYAVPLTKKFGVHNLISRLTETKSEEKLSSATGLAPVLSHCRTPDKQADDVRYWIAGTDTPLSGLSNDTNLTKMQQAQLVAELATLITN